MIRSLSVVGSSPEMYESIIFATDAAFLDLPGAPSSNSELLVEGCLGGWWLAWEGDWARGDLERPKHVNILDT